MTGTATAQEITITRVFDTPRELVWRAWTEPEQDGSEMLLDTVYREVVEPERPAFGEATVTLTELPDGRTEMMFHTRAQMTRETRDRAVGGLSSAFERLAEHLTDPQPRSNA
jgi:uncharacterized protein YndB with AHSA1/START domain